MDEETRRVYVRGLALFSAILADLIGYTGSGLFLGWVAHRYLGVPIAGVILSGAVGLGWAFRKIHQRALING